MTALLASVSAADNLLTAPVIAFMAAILLTLAGFELRLPEALYPILSTYLLFAIGLKGGKALADASLRDIAAPLAAAVGLGVITPVVAYLAFRLLGRVASVDAAALAAHYGSVSAVTFTVVTTTLDARGTDYEGYVAGMLAVLEVIGIVVALVLARRGTATSSWRSAVPEVLRGRSIALLLLGIVVGAVVGSERLAPTDGLFVGLFVGALTLFLVEMGVIAAERLRDLAAAGPVVVVLAMVIPLVNGSIGAVAADLVGLSTGGIAVVATLAASASYIAAPAAVRIALPEASPGLYVTASLGVTFPFNLVVGIPIYIAIAEKLS